MILPCCLCTYNDFHIFNTQTCLRKFVPLTSSPKLFYFNSLKSLLAVTWQFCERLRCNDTAVNKFGIVNHKVRHLRCVYNKLDWSVCTCLTQLYDGRDVYIIYYINNNYMFQHFTLAIFSLRNVKDDTTDPTILT